MKQFVSQIWHSSSARNVGKLLTANVLAQAIGLLIYPILTRLYAPEDFGLLNLFGSIGGVLILLSTLEWYNAIVLPKKEEDARAIVHLCLLSIGVLTLFLCLTIPFAKPIAALFKSPNLAHFYWLLPFYVMLMGIWNVLNYWYIRRKEYGRISGYQISQSLFSAGYKTGFAFLPTCGGLIYASILSPLCSLALSLSLAGRRLLRPLCSIDKAACRHVAAQYANFPKYSTPRAVLNNVVGQLPVLVLTPLFGARLVGFWGMAIMLAFMPISMITRALYQVLYQKTTEMVNARQTIRALYKRFTVWTLLIIIPFFMLLWFVVPSLTAWLLGDEWRTTGEYIRWMLPWLTGASLVLSTGFLPDIFAKQKIELGFEILMAVARTIGVLIGIWRNDFLIAVAGYSVGSAVVSFARYIWQLLLVRRYEESLQ